MLENGLEGVLERIPSDLRASFWARSRRLVCRERSIVRGDGGWVITDLRHDRKPAAVSEANRE